MELLQIPVVQGNVVLTSDFRTRNRARPNHNGVDFGARPRGNPPILSFDSGNIITLQHNHPGAGHWIEVLHDDGSVTTYMHLDAISANLKLGSRVQRGQQIGTMGTTGDSTGIHLHFEIRLMQPRNGGRNAVDPMKFLLEEREMRFQKVEDIPNPQYKRFVQDMLSKNILRGDCQGNLNITEDMIRTWIINERMIAQMLGNMA